VVKNSNFLTYPSCGQITATHQFAGFTLSPGPAPCPGAVHVPLYPDASYQDVPGAMSMIGIQKITDTRPQRTGSFMPMP
jgi:hypothetical protein